MKNLLTLLALSLIGCSSVFYQPDHQLYSLPKLPYEDVSIKTQDGNLVPAWYFKARNPKALVIQFHGNAQNMSAHYLSLVWLVQQGYSLLVFDYRGYGRNRGTTTNAGVLEDGRAVLSYANSVYKGPKIVYGQSLGGAIAYRTLQKFSINADLLVMDSSFINYSQEIRELLPWPASMASIIISNENSSRACPIFYRKLMIIHDLNDPIVPFANEKALLTYSDNTIILNEGKHIAFNGNLANRWLLLRYLDNLFGGKYEQNHQ